MYLFSCSNVANRPFGHWHEVLDGDTIHCYNISDSLVSVDRFTFGISKKVTNKDVYEPIVSGSSFELLKNYTDSNGTISIGDSISWIRMPNDVETFLMDLSRGLLVKIEPPEMSGAEYDLPFDTPGTIVYIGQLREQGLDEPTNGQFQIQINDVIASTADIFGFFNSNHGGNENRIAIIHSDKNTPIDLMKSVTEEMLNTGFVPRNIYRTEISKQEMTMGLVRCK